jgi:hypothetical protein
VVGALSEAKEPRSSLEGRFDAEAQLEVAPELALEVGDRVQGGVGQIVGHIAQAMEVFEHLEAQVGGGPEVQVACVRGRADRVPHPMSGRHHELRAGGTAVRQARVIEPRQARGA